MHSLHAASVQVTLKVSSIPHTEAIYTAHKIINRIQLTH